MNTLMKNFIAIFLIFICGIVFGIGGTLLIERHMIRRALENPERARTVLVRRMVRQYNLTSEQKEAIRLIISEETQKLGEVRMTVAPEVEKILQEGHDRINEQLNESQKVKFEKHYEKWLNTFKRAYYSGTGKPVR